MTNECELMAGLDGSGSFAREFVDKTRIKAREFLHKIRVFPSIWNFEIFIVIIGRSESFTIAMLARNFSTWFLFFMKNPQST